jgi:RHS repeat-associated protein
VGASQLYSWDEVGRLVRARRWDQASVPAGLGSPVVDLQYHYAAGDSRVLKTARDAAGQEVHTAYVFPSLELRRAEFDTDSPGDYTLDSSTEVAYLFANGVRLARLVHQPLDSAGDGVLLRVFFELGDHLGSTSVALDKDTGELVERSTYQAYGGAESSYRPSKWGDFREDYRFTGKEEDVEVGLTYFGKRFYNALLQRWVSPDPLEVHQPGQADANLYAYVSGAALKNIDPLGLQDEEAATPEFSMADEAQTNEALDNAFDPCANDCVRLDTAPSSPPPPRADAREAPKPGDDSMCPGVCHDNPNLTSDEYRNELASATAETLGGSLPYVGESMDIKTLLDKDATRSEKGWAAAGLLVPFVGGKTLHRVLGSGGDDLADAVADAPSADTTRLWRAVEAEELQDLHRFGDYNIHENSVFKRFAFDEASLDAFAKANPERSYTKTYFDLPNDKLQHMVEHGDPRGVGRAIGIDVYETPEFYDWMGPVHIVE